MLSVALSVGSPLLGVTQHPALWSPDFPPRSSIGAATRCTQACMFCFGRKGCARDNRGTCAVNMIAFCERGSKAQWALRCPTLCNELRASQRDHRYCVVSPVSAQDVVPVGAIARDT